MFSRLAAAEHVTVTVHAIAGAVMANPIAGAACAGVDMLSPGALPEGCTRAFGSVTAAAESSSGALRAVEGPLLQEASPVYWYLYYNTCAHLERIAI